MLPESQSKNSKSRIRTWLNSPIKVKWGLLAVLLVVIFALAMEDQFEEVRQERQEKLEQIIAQFPTTTTTG